MAAVQATLMSRREMTMSCRIHSFLCVLQLDALQRSNATLTDFETFIGAEKCVTGSRGLPNLTGEMIGVKKEEKKVDCLTPLC